MNKVYSKTGKLVNKIYFGAVLIWEALVQSIIISTTQNLDLLTINRNSTATYVDENGLIQTAQSNELRIDHITGEPKILVEGQATNLFFESNEWSLWSKESGVTITPNSGIAPDGTNTSALVKASLNDYNRIYTISGTIEINKTYTVSLYIKKSSYNYFLFRVTGFREGNNNIAFDLDNKVITYQYPGYTGFIEDGSNGFLRVGFTTTVTNESSSVYLRFQPFATTDNTISVFDGTEDTGNYYWGYQLEEGSKATSYIPTNGTTVTRLADVVTATPPTGTTQIKETVNGVVNTITDIPTTYQLPVGNVEKIEFS